jgi:hypothetical protein
MIIGNSSLIARYDSADISNNRPLYFSGSYFVEEEFTMLEGVPQLPESPADNLAS